MTSASLSILTNLTENQLEADIDNIYKYQKASLWSASADNQACGLASMLPFLIIQRGSYMCPHSCFIEFIKRVGEKR